MRSYLIYEKRTEAQLPVALFYSQADVARFLGLSWLQVHRIVTGCTQNPYYGIFVDDFDPAEEGWAGQMYCDHLPPLSIVHEQIVNESEVARNG
ncbi:MAG: hypothetical protein IJY50_09765 [Clostridia bacterium]|nr:hypothetical protein [Clostridia bacterium]